jgi:cell division protein FtsQ
MARVNKMRLKGSVRQNMSLLREEGASPLRRFFVRFTFLALLLVFIGSVVFLTWKSGWPQRQVDSFERAALHLTEKAGFRINDIVVKGRDQTSKTDLMDTLHLSIGTPIFSFSPQDIARKIEGLPWVSKALVVRRLPDTVYVELTERIPVARWQNEGKVSVIDKDGVVLESADPNKFPSLLLVIGQDAPQEILPLMKALKEYPSILRGLKASVRVSERRWNLHLLPQIVVKLPERNIDIALQRLDQLIREQKILERNLSAVDLRLPDRFFLESGSATVKGSVP